RRHTRSKRDWSSDVCSSDLFLTNTIEAFQVLIRHRLDHTLLLLQQLSSYHGLYLFQFVQEVDLYVQLKFCLVFLSYLKCVLLQSQFQSLDLAHHLMVGESLLQHSVTQKDRKSTRLNSSHVSISYAVFCLTKKNAIH